ncbi:hypothetical protein [Phenylobacterium sp.]|jgi:hypothetical protein|uniref:hypothetical protein n=1 Tax=Phenylobacterium sp. TaxID=1871053 RepID=UPI002E337327|nr:hypothetical protein [Phenylobacterium sp.]HEX2560733.1 hypothetical protein [Phenylobacterium sp.]
MNDLARLLLWIALAGTVVTLLGSAAIWFMDEERRIRRALKRVLRHAPEAMVIARGRGRGAGFCFSTGSMGVAWDGGAWCLVYKVDELVGAELIVDGQVLARAFRGEPRKAMDQVVAAIEKVTLRLVFDDPRFADFDLDLWLPGDDSGRRPAPSTEAVSEGARWITRVEAILRRAPRPGARVAAPAPQPTPPPMAGDDDEADLDLDEPGAANAA